MLFKFGKSTTGYALPFSGKYLTRLFLLAGFSIFAMAALNLPLFRGRSAAANPEQATQRASRRVVQTAIPPSPFGELGMGVFVADGQPKQVDQDEIGGVSSQSLGPEQLPVVDQRLMQHVLDKTGDRSRRPYYHLMTLAASVLPELLEEYARRDVTYSDLWNEPEKHRGELVYLKGYVRGLQVWVPSQDEFFNPSGLEIMYDGYLLTDESRPNPYVIVVPRVPEGMPVGDNLTENVTFAGYFFKLWRYRAKDGTERAAPLLVGQMLSWAPSPQHPHGVGLSSSLAAAFVLLVIVIAGAIWTVNRRMPRSRLAGPDAGAAIDPKTHQELAELEKLDIADPVSDLSRIEPPGDS